MLETLRTSPWAFPFLEVLHLLGIALLLGNLVLVELRLFGYARRLPLADLARAGLVLALAGFALAAASGLLLFATQAQELLANRAFTLKMGLLMLAGCNAGAFHARDGLARGDFVAKLQAGVSVLLWLAILVAGRWIAYL
jgi:hypothetical protein